MNPTPTTRALHLGRMPLIHLAAIRERFDPARFRSRAVTHLRRWGLAFAAAVAGGVWFHSHYTLGLNATHSLPGTLYLIERGALPSCRVGRLVRIRAVDLAEFVMSGTGP